jgi:hypothetical protein
MKETKNNLNVNEADGHYVYIYREAKGKKIRYVGYGKTLARATSRHSDAVGEFKLQQGYKVEVAGPYGLRETGIAVETALISLRKPDLNSKKAPGPKSFQFRPIWVPAGCSPNTFSNRLSARPLEKTDFTRLGKGKACPLLFVYISEEKLNGRPGFSLDDPPVRFPNSR